MVSATPHRSLMVPVIIVTTIFLTETPEYSKQHVTSINDYLVLSFIVTEN
jgi:hypothetical protein